MVVEIALTWNCLICRIETDLSPENTCKVVKFLDLLQGKSTVAWLMEM
jgi:hypothetical protein